MDVRLLLPLRFQIVFPEGRDIPQSLNDGRNIFDDVIHLFLRIVNGKTETDGTMGSRKGDPHRPENVRGLEGAGGAG